MTRKERYEAFVDHFSENFPEAETELRYENPFELLVAVVLSAQCTDKRVNIVTEKLFLDFPTPESLARSDFDTLFPYLLGLGKRLVEEFDSTVPATMDELRSLPGVGRKTANVILSVLYNQPAMAVDTHVFRVSKRLGLVNQNAKTPLEVEKQLMKHLPEHTVSTAHHWLILHGRYICLARKPNCDACSITHFCRYYERKIVAD